MTANGDKQGASRGSNRSTGNVPHIFYEPSSDATPQGELAALASTYAFVLSRYGSKKTAKVNADDGGTDDDGAGGAPHGRMAGESA